MAANCDVCGKGGLRPQHFTTSPTHEASLEPEHPARAHHRGGTPKRLSTSYVMPQGKPRSPARAKQERLAVIALRRPE